MVRNCWMIKIESSSQAFCSLQTVSSKKRNQKRKAPRPHSLAGRCNSARCTTLRTIIEIGGDSQRSGYPIPAHSRINQFRESAGALAQIISCYAEDAHHIPGRSRPLSAISPVKTEETSRVTFCIVHLRENAPSIVDAAISQGHKAKKAR